jgi:hypothetical protein
VEEGGNEGGCEEGVEEGEGVRGGWRRERV